MVKRGDKEPQMTYALHGFRLIALIWVIVGLLGAQFSLKRHLIHQKIGRTPPFGYFYIDDRWGWPDAFLTRSSHDRQSRLHLQQLINDVVVGVVLVCSVAYSTRNARLTVSLAFQMRFVAIFATSLNIFRVNGVDLPWHLLAPVFFGFVCFMSLLCDCAFATCIRLPAVLRRVT